MFEDRNALDDVEIPQELDLFSEEIEDRFNAGGGSTASTAACGLGSSISTLSSICCGG